MVAFDRIDTSVAIDLMQDRRVVGTSDAEAHRAQLDGREALEPRLRVDEPRKFLRMLQIAADRLPERAEPVIAEREPELQRTEAPRELERLLEDREAFDGVVAQRPCVVGGERERLPRQRGVAVEQQADVDGLVEPLVRVQRNRVRPAEAGESVRSTSAAGAPYAPST